MVGTSLHLKMTTKYSSVFHFSRHRRFVTIHHVSQMSMSSQEYVYIGGDSGCDSPPPSAPPPYKKPHTSQKKLAADACVVTNLPILAAHMPPPPNQTQRSGRLV